MIPFDYSVRVTTLYYNRIKREHRSPVQSERARDYVMRCCEQTHNGVLISRLYS